jgi:hypothetical protein
MEDGGNIVRGRKARTLQRRLGGNPGKLTDGPLRGWFEDWPLKPELQGEE